MFDINAIADKVAKELAEELDKPLPDGLTQTGVAELLKALGSVLTKTGEILGGTENADGDA